MYDTFVYEKSIQLEEFELLETQTHVTYSVNNFGIHISLK